MWIKGGPNFEVPFKTTDKNLSHSIRKFSIATVSSKEVTRRSTIPTKHICHTSLGVPNKIKLFTFMKDQMKLVYLCRCCRSQTLLFIYALRHYCTNAPCQKIDHDRKRIHQQTSNSGCRYICRFTNSTTELGKRDSHVFGYQFSVVRICCKRFIKIERTPCLEMLCMTRQP